MGELQKAYTPRRVRQARAFRAVQVGSTTALATVATAILAIIGVLSWWIPLILLVVTFVCVRAFRGATRR